jgi:protein phosphatase 1 regulatory subunit 11
MAAAAQLSGAGTLVLPQQQQQGVPATSTTAHPTISDAVTLRLVPRRKKKSVKWAEDVAEINENSGKRKSKKCCIFHRRRQFGDWSDDDDSDMECDCDNQQPDLNQGPPTPGAQPGV